MQIPISKPAPSSQELAAILKQELSTQYSYQLFGLGRKTILVGKSTWVGAQITIRKNEISIQATPPSVLGSLLSFLGLTEFGFLLVLFIGRFWALPSQWRNLEKEIGIFLKQRYN